jgi:hypothetical protein
MPPLTSLPSPLFAPVAGGDGAPAAPHPLDVTQKARVFVNEDTGVRFESLVLFAEPLFELYDLDATDAFDLRSSPGSADEATVAVLEAGRLLWAYFSLPAGARDKYHDALADQLLGPDHAPDEEADFEMVLDRMQEQWDMLEPEDRELAEGVGARTLTFEELLVHPAFAAPIPAREEGVGYGPDRLSELEAQALFAQPLLDAAAEPEAMEAAMERANAYWELAKRPRDERESGVKAIVQAYASAAAERDLLKQEALQMLQRFDALFPEH